MGGVARIIPVLDRIRRRTTVDGDCWLWTGATNPDGYGHVSMPTGERGGVKALVHRIAYELLVGPIPEGLELDHLCRRPACWRPAHLEPVTPAENARRREEALRPTCSKGHPYTAVTAPRRRRRCLVCHAAAERRRRARRAASSLAS